MTLKNAEGKRRLIEGDLKQKIFVDAKLNSVQWYLLSFEEKTILRIFPGAMTICFALNLKCC